MSKALKVSYRRTQAIKQNIQRKWKLSINTNNKMLSLMKRDEGFKKLMLSVGKSKMYIEEDEEEDSEEIDFFKAKRFK